jgi:hypothetical protein
MRSYVEPGWLLLVAAAAAGCGGGSVTPPASVDASVDARVDASVDASRSDCVVFTNESGCLGLPTLVVANTAYPSTIAETRRCTAEAAPSTVRLRLCVAPPRLSCREDDGVAYCGVVDLARAALSALAGGAELRLDGESRFVFPSYNVYEVRPSDVTYVPVAPVAAVQRAWMEKGCYCTPTYLGGAQTFTGTLRFDAAPSGRLRGRLAMTASGIVSPTTWLTERVELATDFDVAIPPESP